MDELIDSLDPRKDELLISALTDLKDVIGLDDVKDKVCRQVKYAIYNLKRNRKISGMHHTLITGEPGLGKSMLATKLGNIWLSLGILDYKSETVNTAEVELGELTNFLMWLHKLSSEPSPIQTTTRGKQYKANKNQLNKINIKRRRHLRSSISAYIDRLYQGPLSSTYKTHAWRTIKDIVKGGVNIDRETPIYNEFNDEYYLDFTGRKSGVIPTNSPVPSYFKTITGDIDENPSTPSVPSVPPVPSGPSVPPVTSKPICKVFRKSDLVGKYVGHTAPKTEAALESCLGGVFILDEAYSLLNSSSCKFGIECLNCINQFMSEHPNEIIIIFCGYKDMIENLYNAQRGLARRFNWVYDLTKYSSDELVKIYKSKLEDFGFEGSANDSNICKLFEDNKDVFKFQGGDVENLATLTQIEVATTNWNKEDNSEVARRTRSSFASTVSTYKKFDSISMDNIKNALVRFKKSRTRVDEIEPLPDNVKLMYL